MKPHTLRFGELSLQGRSWAGDETWLRVHPPGLAFDSGRGALPLAGAPDLFLTHGHLDHALGVPFVLSQRTMHRQGLTRVYCPLEVAEPLEQLIAAAARLEGASYSYEIRALEPRDRVEVGRDLAVEAFACEHVVPALGYHLLRRRHHLAPAFQGRRPEELAGLRSQGVDVEEVSEEVWLSYCGDTGPEVFEREPRLYDSTVLVLECTFAAPGHEERARSYGHLHLRDLTERAERFRNRALVLHHLSRRHRPEELRRAIAEGAPELAPRVHFLTGAA